MIWGNVAGSTARTPTDVLLPCGPRAFGLNGRRLGPRGLARETCDRLVRLLVKPIGRDWFAIRIMSAPSASSEPTVSMPKVTRAMIESGIRFREFRADGRIAWIMLILLAEAAG